MPLLAALERLNIHYRQYLSMHCAPIERNCIGTDRPCPARYTLYEDKKYADKLDRALHTQSEASSPRHQPPAGTVAMKDARTMLLEILGAIPELTAIREVSKTSNGSF